MPRNLGGTTCFFFFLRKQFFSRDTKIYDLNTVTRIKSQNLNLEIQETHKNASLFLDSGKFRDMWKSNKCKSNRWDGTGRTAFVCLFCSAKSSGNVEYFEMHQCRWVNSNSDSKTACHFVLYMEGLWQKVCLHSREQGCNSCDVSRSTLLI